MPDIIDDATDHIEKSMAAALEAQRNKPPLMPPTGNCYNCGESVADGAKFCDIDCRHDFELRNRRK
jgi:hypothetical protein